MLNKDVAKLIGSYSKPRIWKYWIYNAWEHNNMFKNTRIKQADSEEELVRYLYDNYLEIIVKNSKRIYYTMEEMVGGDTDDERFRLSIRNGQYVKYEEVTDY